MSIHELFAVSFRSFSLSDKSIDGGLRFKYNINIYKLYTNRKEVRAMPLQIIRNDITKTPCDAIVNAANPTLLGGGGVDGAIHTAAGRALLRECKKLGGCQVGQAKITKGYDLPCKYVIHTVGPVWHGGNSGEKELLESCYRESLKLALKYNCESVAFPLISAGTYSYPKAEALQVAINEIGRFLLAHDMLVYIVVFDKGSFQVSKKLINDITEYIDEYYVEANFCERSTTLFSMPLGKNSQISDTQAFKTAAPQSVSESLNDALNRLDESFSQMLLRKIDEKGMTDAEVYKKANVDRRLFSKIRSDVHYKTSKTTAVAFAIALELDLDETRDFLMKAGFALSHSNKFDVIIEYFIKNGNYNIFEINEALFEFDQVLLGC